MTDPYDPAGGPLAVRSERYGEDAGNAGDEGSAAHHCRTSSSMMSALFSSDRQHVPGFPHAVQLRAARAGEG
jgi:hypothetical protein